MGPREVPEAPQAPEAPGLPAVVWTPYVRRAARPRTVDWLTAGGFDLELLAEGGQYVIRRTPLAGGGEPEEAARGWLYRTREVWTEMTGRSL